MPERSPFVKRIHTLIVLGGTSFRQNLPSLISQIPAIDTVAIADGVASALSLIEERHPELVVIGTDTPLTTAIEIQDRTHTEIRTAFAWIGRDSHIRIFDVKESADLFGLGVCESKDTDLDQGPHESQRDVHLFSRTLTSGDPIFLKLNNKYHVVRVDSILSITAVRHYTYVTIVDGRKGIASKSMRDWQIRLPRNSFTRIHRNAIVNLDHVERIEEIGGHSFQVYLKGLEKPLSISSRCFARIRRQLN